MSTPPVLLAKPTNKPAKNPLRNKLKLPKSTDKEKGPSWGIKPPPPPGEKRRPGKDRHIDHPNLER